MQERESTGVWARTIVVVDDEATCLVATRQALEHAGYRVLTRNGPAGCIAAILQERPDLVLFDLGMSTGGDVLIKMMRAADRAHDSLLFLYSATSEPVLRDKAMQVGADGYVCKALGERSLVASVRSALIGRPTVARGQGSAGPRRGRLGARPAGGRDFPPTDRARPSGLLVSVVPPPSLVSARRSLSSAHLDAVRGALGSLPNAPRAEYRQAMRSGVRTLGMPKVLFVDDDMVVLSGYRRQLQSYPVQFEFALSGTQALHHICGDSPPSVVVSDLLMPEPDGGEVFRRALEHHPGWRHRFVVVTGCSEQAAAKRLDSGFGGVVLKKPADTQQLLEAIRVCLPQALPPASGVASA